MIRENWAFWIILIGFISQVIVIFMHANGYKRTTTWNANLSDRLIGIILCIIFGIIYAIALGWI